MKKINNKAFTVVELIITFSIVMVISLGLLKVVDSYREKQQNELYKKEILSYKNEVIKRIEDDFLDKAVKNIEGINALSGYNQCITITFGDDTTKDLCANNLEIMYDNIKYKYPNRFIQLKDDFIYSTQDTIIDLSTGKEEAMEVNGIPRKICAINIKLRHTEIKEDFDINIVAVANNTPVVSRYTYTGSGEIPDVITTFQIGSNISFTSNSVNDKRITNMELTNNIASVSPGAFKGSKITNLKISASNYNKYINNILDDTTKISNITIIGNGSEEINSTSNNINLNSLELKNIKSVNGNTFKNKSINELIVSNIKTIGKSAFENSGITTIKIGEKVEKIEDNAFKGNKLTEIDFSKSSSINIGSYSFANNQIEKITPNKLTMKKDSFDYNKLTCKLSLLQYKCTKK